MAATITRLRADKTNYSRYDAQANTVTAICYLTGVGNGDTVSVQLVRKDGYGPVLTVVSPPLAGAASSVRLALPLEACVDAVYPAIYRAKAGDYTLKDAHSAVESPVFSVSLVSLRRIRQEVCKGLPLFTSETLGPLEQPRLVTGVTITNVKPDMVADVYPLSFTASGKLLAWDGGTPVDVSAGGSFHLISALAKWWVRVDVDELLLPGSDVTEQIAVDEQEFTDSALLAELKHAETEIADRLEMQLEPTQVCTDQLKTWLQTHTLTPPVTAYADQYALPTLYQRPDDMGAWFGIQLPYRGLIQVEALHGYINQSEIITIDQTWITCFEKLGLAQLVPNQNAIISWQFYTGAFYAFIMGGYDYVPNFWHYKATVGLRDLRERRANVLQAVEYTAGVNILRQAALHSKPGYTSESLSRDGVSQNISYQRGIYGDTIQQYERWLEENLKRIKHHVYGPAFIII